MVTNRTPIPRTGKAQITPAAIKLYRAFINADTDDARDNARRSLHKALKRSPWQETVTGTLGYTVDEPPPDFIVEEGALKLLDWNEARAIRMQLDAAIALGVSR